MIKMLRTLCVLFLSAAAFAAVQVKPTTTVAAEQANVVSQLPVHKLFFDGYTGTVLAIYHPSNHVTDDLQAIKARGFDGIVVPESARYTRRIARQEHLIVAKEAQINIGSIGDCGRDFLNGVVAIDHAILQGNVKSIGIDWNAVVSGVDVCSYLSTSVTDSTLYFHTNAPVPTVNRYTVFISQNGDSLMPLLDVAPSAGSLDLRTFNISTGTYYLYVKMVGQPLMDNRLSSAVPYVVK